jgi:hypothetical protein
VQDLGPQYLLPDSEYVRVEYQAGVLASGVIARPIMVINWSIGRPLASLIAKNVRLASENRSPALDRVVRQTTNKDNPDDASGVYEGCLYFCLFTLLVRLKDDPFWSPRCRPQNYGSIDGRTVRIIS